jgi:hypothetical protein
MSRSLLGWLVVLISWSTMASAATYDDARWRSQITVGTDTLRFWLDPGIYDEARSGFMKWDESQAAARFGCMNCDPRGWGTSEFMQYRMNQMLKEQNPRYLADLTFLFLNIERVGVGAGVLSFRMTAADLRHHPAP